MNEERFAELEAQVQRLTARVHQLEDSKKVLYPVVAPAQRASLEGGKNFQPKTKVQKQPSPTMEWLGARWLAVIGAVLVLVGIIFALSYSIQQGWISPAVRVSSGLLLCLVLYIAALRIHKTSQAAGGGLAIVGLLGAWICTGFAVSQYALLSQSVGLFLGGGICLAAVWITYQWRSELFACTALAGMFVTPWLAEVSYTPSIVLLFLPLLVLATTVVIRSGWLYLWVVSGVLALSCVTTQYQDSLSVTTVLSTLSVLLACVGGLALFTNTEDGGMHTLLSNVSIAIMAVIGWSALHFLNPEQNDLSLVWLLACACVFVAVAVQHSQSISLALGSACLSAAWVGWFNGGVLTAVLLLQAGIFIVLAANDDHRRIGFGTLTVASVHAIGSELSPDGLKYGIDHLGQTLLSITSFMTLGVVMYLRKIYRDIAVAILGLIFVYGVSLLIIDATVSVGDTNNVGQSIVSGWWAVCGVAILSVKTSFTHARTAGLFLLAAAGAKLLLFDSSNLDVFARVMAFIGIGLLFVFAAHITAKQKDKQAQL